MEVPDNLVYLHHILDAIVNVEDYIKGYDFEKFAGDKKSISAVLREISVLGEAALRTTEQFRKKHPEVKWKEIFGTRNKLIHDYMGVRLDIVWETIQTSLPELKRQVEAILEAESL